MQSNKSIKYFLGWAWLFFPAKESMLSHGNIYCGMSPAIAALACHVKHFV